MSVSIISRKIDARKITIKLVDGSVVHGKINLHRGEVDIGRVSDLFTKITDPFIVVFDATTAEGLSGRVLILKKNNVVWVSPEDDFPQEDKQPREEEKPDEDSGGSFLDRLRST